MQSAKPGPHLKLRALRETLMQLLARQIHLGNELQEKEQKLENLSQNQVKEERS